MENNKNKKLSLFCSIISVLLIFICLLFFYIQNELNKMNIEIKMMKEENKNELYNDNNLAAGVTKAVINKVKCNKNECVKNESKKENEKENEKENTNNFNEENEYDSLELLAKCVFAEAGNQGLYGQELVACVILNRVDSNSYPNTVEGVIKQKNQFATYPKAIEKANPTEETYKAIENAINDRANKLIISFRTGHYHSWCKPAFKYKDHYFGY